MTVAVTGALGLALMLVAAPTQAAATCAFDSATGDLTLTYDAANQEIRLTRLPDSSTRVDHRTAPATDYTVISCGAVAPTVTNTERILATGTAANNQDLRVDLSGGPLAPGKTAEPTGTSDIELVANLGEPAPVPPGTPPPPPDSGDSVIMSGTAGVDVLDVRGNGFNMDDDVGV